MEVRQTSLDDIRAISALFCARIPIWQRINAQGQVETVPYEALTVYERWMHGGPWMSVETCAILINHLLLGAGIPLVAVGDGQVVGYVEAYHSLEPDPFGRSLHIADLIAPDEEIERALLTGLIARAKALKCQHVTVTRVGGEAPYGGRYSLKPISTLRRFNLPARQGQIFYRAVEHLNYDAAQIVGWGMPLGRYASSRQHWETLWPTLWETMPEMRQHKTARRQFSAAGQEALMFCREHLYDPRRAEIYLWAPKPLNIQLVSAVRDWAHREGYRTLVMAVDEQMQAALGTEAEDDGYFQETCALTLSG